MNMVQKMSTLYAPTLKEAPVEAELASHILLLRAAMIRKVAAGVYTFLPLGMRVLSKIEDIIREEMDAIGSDEIMMPALQPGELWHESGRWNDYGPELMRLSDRHDNEFCLGPTHEELITAIVRNELRSYRELPRSMYQIQVKFRDEIRPRYGLLRTREFIMKDAYSFHADLPSLQEHYNAMGAAYGRVCERLGLVYRPVEADTGQIGGKVSIEYMALADAGEAELVYCECGYASDIEAASANIVVVPDIEGDLEKVSTPGAHTIADLAAFFGIPENATVKALSVKDGEGNPVVLFVPGDHELNEIKATNLLGAYEMLSDEEMEQAGLVKGFMGPIGLPEGIRVICDESLKQTDSWLVGANDPGYHYRSAKPGRDFEVKEWASVVSAKPGDLCPVCGKPLSYARGIEVGQIFQLGTKYSSSMGATFADEDGNEKPFLMGSYGIGVTRAIASVVEQHNDEHGIIWPVSVAPYEVCVVPIGKTLDDPANVLAAQIADELCDAGIEVILDDRDERAGVKFADDDLFGFPYQVVIGKRGIESDEIEIKVRETGERIKRPAAQIASCVAQLVQDDRRKYAFESFQR